MRSGQVAKKSPTASGLVPWVFTALLTIAVGFGVFALLTPSNRPAAPRAQSVSTAPVVPRSVPVTQEVREPMPVGDLPGWHQVFADNFGGALDPSTWRFYSGQVGGDPGGWFEPSHVTVSNGMLVISGYRDPADGGRWATGGVSTAPGFVQTYGKYLVQFRLDRGPGIAHALVLTPANGSWPPEIDFSEDNGTWRHTTQATLHYGATDSTISKRLSVDLMQWNTLGVEWTPGIIRFTVDGRVWFTITGNAVPTVPMALALQTQAWPCVGTWGTCPDASTPPAVRMYVDWVVAYAPTQR